MFGSTSNFIIGIVAVNIGSIDLAQATSESFSRSNRRTLIIFYLLLYSNPVIPMSMSLVGKAKPDMQEP